MDNGLDMGIWNVPRNWDEVTLKQYQEIEEYYADKDRKFDIRDVLHIFCNKTIDEVNALPISFTAKIMDILSFLETAPKVDKASAVIKIDGEVYQCNVMEKMKTGEYLAIDTIIKSNPHDYSSMFAVLCRKPGEIFDSKFEAEIFDKRKEMFERQSITKIMPLISFFLSLFLQLKIPFLLYSQAEEELNLIQRSINDSQKIGVFKRRYLNLRMKKLRKLLQSSKSI